MREPTERIALLETMLAALIDHVDQVGCYNRFGERLGDQVPVVKQARMVLGDDAWNARHRCRIVLHRQASRGDLSPALLFSESASMQFTSAPFEHDARHRLRWQRLPSRNDPCVEPGLGIVGDAGEQPTQLDRSREFALLEEDGADGGSFSFGDAEHDPTLPYLRGAGQLLRALHLTARASRRQEQRAPAARRDQPLAPRARRAGSFSTAGSAVSAGSAASPLGLRPRPIFLASVERCEA